MKRPKAAFHSLSPKLKGIRGRLLPSFIYQPRLDHPNILIALFRILWQIWHTFSLANFDLQRPRLPELGFLRLWIRNFDLFGDMCDGRLLGGFALLNLIYNHAVVGRYNTDELIFSH